MLSRRKALEGTLLLCAAGALAGGLPSGATPAAEGVNDSEHGVFLRLSRALTGFEALDEGLARHYAAFLAAADPEGWRALIDGARATAGGAPPSATAMTGRVAALWYSGWTEPADGVAPAVRAEGYRQALAWRAMARTPRGLPTGRLWQAP